MKKEISWNQFEYVNKGNLTDAFEDLTRIYFKIEYAKNISIELIAKNSIHPGFEADPIEYNGKKLAFQSKYSNSSVYDLFIESLKIAKKIYKGQVDIIYLFTNRGLDSRCAGYKKMMSIGEEIGAQIVPVAGKTILDTILMDDAFKNARTYFFDEHEIDDEWFQVSVNSALEQQKDKYDRQGFNLVTSSIQHLLDYAFENEFAVRLKEIIDEIYRSFNLLINKQYLASFKRKYDEELRTIIEKNITPSLNEQDFLKLPKCVDEISKDVEKEINELNNKYYESEDGLDEVEQQYLYYLQDVNNIVSEIKYSKSKKALCSIAKVHIVEGGFGCGKTHLFKYVADKRLREGKRSLLLYGDSFNYSESTLEEEILKVLNIHNLSFDEFLKVLEAKGERDGCFTFLMIDAINECSNYSKWRTNLKSLLDKVNLYSHIKVFISLRDSYSKECLGDNLFQLQSSGKLFVHNLRGLQPNGNEIPQFLNYYGIKYTDMSLTAIEVFTRPLLLNLYCKSHTGKEVGYINNIDRISIINDYINYEENRWQIQDKTCPILQFNAVIHSIGEFLVSNYTKKIPLENLVQKLSSKSIDQRNIKYMKLSDILEEKVDEDSGNKYVQFYYDAFLDKACSDVLFDADREKCETNIVDFIDSGERFRIIQSAISLLLNKYKQKFGDEMDSILKRLSEKLDKNVFSSVFKEYLGCLFDDPSFDMSHITSRYKQYLITQEACNLVWNRIINKQNESNNYYLLDDLLFGMELPKRDYLWTIYINNQYEGYERRLKDCLNTIFNKEYEEISDKEIILIVWLLTSSNRELRDYVSKQLVCILKERQEIIPDLLNKYLGVNDPYIVSRLLAATFGAIVISNCADEKLLIEISNSVFEKIFNLEVAYEDIQIRDYARNIIEYVEHKGIKLEFDTKKCYPPYSSKNVPQLSIEEVEALYPRNDYEHNIFYGTDSIASSMTPELTIGKLTNATLYGDFGRYIFDSTLRDFKFNDEVKDRKRIFLYAYYYIVNCLGYDNNLFTEYDREHYSYRSRKSATERIGKKYQWLSMFHTLAKVADNYKVGSCFDRKSKGVDYSGTWNPYLRDFDPTQLLQNNDRIYETKTGLFISHFNCFDFDENEWVNKNKNSFDIEGARCLKDTSGNEWIAISTTKKDETGSISEAPYQSIWFRLKAYLVKKADIAKNVKSFIDKDYSELTNGIYENGNYQLYAFDYCWNSSYVGYYDDNNLIDITKSHKVKVKSSEQYKASHNIRILLGDKEIDLSDNGEYHFETKYRRVSRIVRLSHEYMWEAEYDYSKTDTITYEVPSKALVDMLEIHQIASGVWVNDDNEMVLADFSLFKNSDVDGLYVKKDYLFSKLPENMSLVWVARGELLFSREKYGSNRDRHSRNIMIYYDSDGTSIKRIDLDDD